MDVFTHYSDSNPIGSRSFWSVFDEKEYSYYPVLSDSSIASTVTTAVPPASFSDEEVMLASRNPKKRAGRKKFRETRHPVYRGVRRRNSGKWVCEVREPNKKSRIWLGTFPTAEMAARAHDVAALSLRGRSACLNFADSAWRLPVPASSETKDIQKAAAEAAEAFRPEECVGRELMRRGNDREMVAETAAGAAEEMFYIDDEEIFGMPGLLANMAEGMLLPPPNCGAGGDSWDNLETIDADMSLWILHKILLYTIHAPLESLVRPPAPARCRLPFEASLVLSAPSATLNNPPQRSQDHFVWKEEAPNQFSNGALQQIMKRVFPSCFVLFFLLNHGKQFFDHLVYNTNAASCSR
ncbi:unnamed protein product [Dovyalis caffra]|uniref:AP2/ERF domain-containing protein n=1 Tax=Dovyalis caffra TaxID=77055 RepID=A0AAV1RN30_9ROSI|nr:unnamed protein product [Dovyalis caffra]